MHAFDAHATDADLRAAGHYWRTGYDGRSCEARLDRIGQFRTTIDGLGIHFLHRRSARPDATPLILTHGWPGSIVEFVDVVDELADPNDADAPAFPRRGPLAARFRFQRQAGHPTFLAHGGDWGGVITTILGGRFPEHVLGIHTTFAEAPPGLPTDGPTAVERG